MEISKSLEEYVKTMYILQKETGEIKVTHIAEKMNFSKASVNKAVKQLAEKKLVSYEAYGKIELLPEGIKVARKLLEAYDIVYVFLKDLLHLDEEDAAREAENMKQSMEDETLNKLVKYVHKVLGLPVLNGYDIKQEKCIECHRRIKSENIQIKK